MVKRPRPRYLWPLPLTVSEEAGNRDHWPLPPNHYQKTENNKPTDAYTALSDPIGRKKRAQIPESQPVAISAETNSSYKVFPLPQASPTPC